MSGSPYWDDFIYERIYPKDTASNEPDEDNAITKGLVTIVKDMLDDDILGAIGGFFGSDKAMDSYEDFMAGEPLDDDAQELVDEALLKYIDAYAEFDEDDHLEYELSYVT